MSNLVGIGTGNDACARRVNKLVLGNMGGGFNKYVLSKVVSNYLRIWYNDSFVVLIAVSLIAVRKKGL